MIKYKYIQKKKSVLDDFLLKSIESIVVTAMNVIYNCKSR